MNSVERFLAAIYHKPVDRPPVTGVITTVTPKLMDLCGVYYPQAHNDPTMMAELAAAAWKFTGLESLKLPFDMTVEAGALGCPVNWGSKRNLPQVSESIWSFDNIPQADNAFFSTPRILTVLSAIKLAVQRYGTEVPVISSIVGPFSLATMLYGIQSILELTIGDPDRLAKILLELTDLCIKYANAQLNSGSHAILVGEAACSGDLISHQTYNECIVPAHTKLMTQLDAPSILHICGDITRALPAIAQTKVTGLSFDAAVDMNKARGLLKGRISLIGNIDPIMVLQHGTEIDVQRSVYQAIEDGIDIVNAGCIWPADMPLGQAVAMVQAVKNNV